MIRKNIITLLVLAAGVTATFAAETAVLRKGGECKIQVAGMFDDSKVFTTSLTNAEVQVTCKFKADDDFFGDYVVIANPSINNKAGKKLNVAYSVAFFDSAGELVGCASQGGEVDVGAKDYQFASCIIRVPPALSAKITSYKVVIYVDEAKK